MNGYSTSDDHQPLTYWGNVPLFAAHMIVVVLVISMIATALAGNSAILGLLSFDSSRVLRGEIWRVVTYGFVNRPTLWFAIEMMMIIWFGREIEKAFGRRKFFVLYAGLFLLPPALLTLLGTWYPTALAGQNGGFGLFIAFATLYPHAMMIANLLAKWVAVILVGLYALIHLSARDWVAMIKLATTTGFAFGFVRHAQGLFSLPSFPTPRSKPKLRVLPDLPPERGEKPLQRKDTAGTMAEVDALLDKIAKSGIGSLTAKERATLDSARQTLKLRRSSRE